LLLRKEVINDHIFELRYKGPVNWLLIIDLLFLFVFIHLTRLSVAQTGRHNSEVETNCCQPMPSNG
jgi:hypothetical protein